MPQTDENTFSSTPPATGAPPGHDWEAIFESPETGFIHLVKQAKTVDGLRECTHLIIRSLFSRDDDMPIRDVYEHALDGMLPKTGIEIQHMDKGVSQIVQLLREIKEYRQTKSQEHADQLLQKPAGETVQPDHERREDRESEPLPGLEFADPQQNIASDDEEQVIAEMFADLFCARIKKRFDVLTANVGKSCKKPPFILSTDFARHFETLLRQHFIPCFLENSRALVARTAQQPENLRREYLANQFNGRVSSQNLWDRWQDIWAQLIHPQDLPAKPEPEKKTGLLGGLKKKKKKVPAFMRELTLDEWKVRTRKIKQGNKKTAELWALIVTKSDAYQLPEFEDEKLLMELFGRSASGLQNHINALRQIAQQGTDIGRGLSAYAQGKDIDLAVLATCYQNPDLFLGKNMGLTQMLLGKDDAEITSSLPLVKRYLL
ncbi:MAG: hypothetical protein ISR45_09345 [Rhodospirillales bacterium]|nr:hypothetical protein [Rhodospirillales bacterium]